MFGRCTPHFGNRPRHFPFLERCSSEVNARSRLYANVMRHVTQQQRTYVFLRALCSASVTTFTMPGWDEATAVQKLSSNTYTSTLHDDWCIGTGKVSMKPPASLHADFVQFRMVDM
jgi:hypothetical protein